MLMDSKPTDRRGVRRLDIIQDVAVAGLLLCVFLLGWGLFERPAPSRPVGKIALRAEMISFGKPSKVVP